MLPKVPRPLLLPTRSRHQGSPTTCVPATTEQGAACVTLLPSTRATERANTLPRLNQKKREKKSVLCQISLWKLAAACSCSASCHRVGKPPSGRGEQTGATLTNQRFSSLLEKRTAQSHVPHPGDQDSRGVRTIYKSRGGRTPVASGPAAGGGRRVSGRGRWFPC